MVPVVRKNSCIVYKMYTIWDGPDPAWRGYISELIIGLRSANERRRYFVTTALIGWAQAYNQPCCTILNAWVIKNSCAALKGPVCYKP